jgi:transposase
MRARPLALRRGDRDVLASWTRASTVRAGLAQRARIVLLAADGVSNTEIADRVGVARQTVISWRARYVESGVKGLVDEKRSGRPRKVDRARILAATLGSPPKKLGVTHWSSRLLADQLKTDASTVLRTWRHYRVQPWGSETFKFSTDPELVAKVTDVVGLYLAPPENAIVLSIDEKSQIQALDRTQKMLPMQPGFPERHTHDYVRHGTSRLFAALEVATGRITAACKPRHRHQEFLAFLKQIARTYPESFDEHGRPIELHLIMDNYATHKRVEVRKWLADNPRIKVHFTPTSGSWMNLVEVWFGIIERQAIHRGTLGSVKDLNAKIRAFIDGWNDRCHPFVWTKTADQILKKATRPATSVSGH